ncbi:unnamed protein product [Fusarium graminearum]|uniref:Uncharacterized protein n=1 Tax=Gibberella zeae TaxID=5518 RepID=A0A9N8NCQ7_GIBZA|nr:unnamed protein product [Fusarium graminearum]
MIVAIALLRPNRQEPPPVTIINPTSWSPSTGTIPSYLIVIQPCQTPHLRFVTRSTRQAERSAPTTNVIVCHDRTSLRRKRYPRSTPVQLTMDAPPTNESTQTLDKSIHYLIQHLNTCSVLAQTDVDLSTLKDKTELPMTYALLCMLVGRTEMLNERIVNDNQDAPLNPYTQREHYVMQVRRFHHVRRLRDLSDMGWRRHPLR